MNEEEILTAVTGGGAENADAEATAKAATEAGTEEMSPSEGGETEPAVENAAGLPTDAALESANETVGTPATEAEENGETSEIPATKVEEGAISETEMAAILADPMFLPFARGRKGELMTICRDFRDMLAAGGARTASHVTASVTARMTPTSVSALPEVALSERQRSLARAAGMTYREYFELASDIPNTIYIHK